MFNLRFKAGLILILLIALVMLISACSEKDPINADGREGPRKDPQDNIPPETYLHLSFEEGESPDTSTSNKDLYWWGEDQDGRILGYEYRWGQIVFEDSVSASDTTDTLAVPIDTTWINNGDWYYTEEESEFFTLPIRTISATFTFQIRAMDSDSIFDPTPAEMSFPVINSRPEIEFLLSSNPLTMQGEDYYTFPIRTFVFNGTDIDGNETIETYSYALDPVDGDTTWVSQSADSNFVTLRNLEAGSHTFWIKCTDIAGFDSPLIHFPDTTNINSIDPQHWIVKTPAAGGRLIVDDYALDDINNNLNFYHQEFQAQWGAEHEEYSVWEIGDELPYASQDVTETLLMFDRVFWFSYYGSPNVAEAFNSVVTFLNTEDKRFVFSTNVVDTVALMDLAYPDSLTTSNPWNIGNTPVDTVFVESESDLPTLQCSGTVGRYVVFFTPKDDAEVIYRLDDAYAEGQYPLLYQGNPVVGLRRPDKSYAIISLPLYEFQGIPGSVGLAIKRLFEE